MKEKMIMKKKERVEFCIGILLIAIILLTLFFFLSHFYYCRKCENSIEQMQKMNSSVFSLKKIFLYSSASTKNQSSSALLDLDISQFTDIAIFLDNHANGNYTLENTIKELSIDQISFSPMPNQGTPSLYLKNLNDFGKIDDFSAKNPIQDSINFPIVESKDQIDYSNFEIASTCSSPIVLEYVNQDVQKNYRIASETNPSLDGSILKKAGIPFSSMETTLSLRIHLVNGLEEHFVCNVSIPISLKDDSNNRIIYDGSLIQEINNLQNYTFLKKVTMQ